jgi:transposase
LINRLVLENLKSRPLRTLLSAVAIGVQVTMVLTLVGISRGTVEDGLQRVDEKSQIQALDRTQPGLPLKKGRCGTMTHDYKRNGTATLFAALDVADGTVISMCHDRHRHQEWLSFLRVIDQVTPAGKELHLIVDNYATHKHAKVQRWLKRHPRFHVHFTPSSSSWLNMVERFFRDLTQNRLRRGVFRDVEELIMAIGYYIDRHNENPKPFIWTAKARDILEKVKHARKSLDNVKSV